jgi:DNA repair photolyase
LALPRVELQRRRGSIWTSPIVIGTAVDPYQPVEGSQRITRSLLQEILAAKAPVQIITKNTMVVRDTDLLAQIASQTHCAVFISLNTLDAMFARRMEPATPPPEKRLAAIRTLVERGVPAGLMLAPVLPWLTDEPGTIEALALAAHSAKAQWITSGTLRLHPDVRPVFFAWLQRERPDLLSRYWEMYRWTDAPERYRDRLHARIATIREALGMPAGPPPLRAPFEQLTLF